MGLVALARACNIHDIGFGFALHALFNFAALRLARVMSRGCRSTYVRARSARYSASVTYVHVHVLIDAHLILSEIMDGGNPFSRLFSSVEAVHQATEVARAQNRTISDVLTKIFLITINQMGG